MPSYAQNAQTALKLISAKGQSATLQRRGADAVFNPTTGTFSTPGATLTMLLKCVVLPVGSEWAKDTTYAADFVRGKLRKLLIASVGLVSVPQVGDTVTGIESGTWKLIGFSNLSPAGVDVVYTATIVRL